MAAVCGGAGGKAAAAQTQTAGGGLTRGKAGSCAAVYVAAHNPCGQGLSDIARHVIQRIFLS